MIDVLISPVLPGILAVVGLLWLRRRRWLRIGCGVVALVSLLLLMPLGANALTVLVETHADDRLCNGSPATIVVLAGGADEDAAKGNYAALGQASFRRLIGGIAAWRATPGAILVLSGGAHGEGSAEADLMAAMARDLGVPAAAIRIESHSLTTWQSAAALHDLEPPLPARVRLVTSALHMPRALYAMRVAGFDVCGTPVDYRAEGWFGLPYLLPSASAASKSEAALHEIVGGVTYRLRHALFGDP